MSIDSPTELRPYLSQTTESRFTPKDSISVTYFYDKQGQVTEEHFSVQPARRAYSVFTIYNDKELVSHKNYNDQFRLNIFNKNQQLISSKKYFAQSGFYWRVFELDTLIYKQNQLVSQEHRDFYFTADSQGYASSFPLWLTKRAYIYDPHNRISTEIDSVFLTHDFPKGRNDISPVLATYQFTNRSNYEYNDKGEVIRKVTVSGANNYPFITFSNGWSIYNQFGAGWSTYFYSWPGRFLEGITTYAYDYSLNNKPIRKSTSFEDSQTKKVYRSISTYTYN